MKDMRLISMGEAWERMSLAERRAIYEEPRQLAERLAPSGKLLGGSPLPPPSMATSVRVREGRRLVTDGPFAETCEHPGGYMLIEARDLDEAIAIAAEGAVARGGSVEVRPVREGPPS